MKANRPYSYKTPRISADAVIAVVKKHAAINKLIEAQAPIDPELSKNFVSFPLSDNPYKK